MNNLLPRELRETIARDCLLFLCYNGTLPEWEYLPDDGIALPGEINFAETFRNYLRQKRIPTFDPHHSPKALARILEEIKD
jgi:hypothetical protein